MVRTDGFFEYVDQYFDYRKDLYNASDQTLKSNRIDLFLFEDFMKQGGHKEVSGKAVIQFQKYLKTDRDNCGGSINRKLFTLRSYGHFLSTMDVQGAERLPFYDVLKIRQGYRNRPDALTPEQIRRLFDVICRDTIQGIRDYSAYALMYMTGLRVGEVYNLGLSDIDLEKKTIYVTGKGRKNRTLYLTDELAQCLSEWISVRPMVYKSADCEALFVSKKGNRLAIRTLEDNFKKIVEKAELNVRFNVTCHTLRHSFASHLNEEEVDILVIQSLMGHATARSTETYIHASIKKIRESLEKLPGVLFLKALLKSGEINLKFQRNKPKIE